MQLLTGLLTTFQLLTVLKEFSYVCKLLTNNSQKSTSKFALLIKKNNTAKGSTCANLVSFF